MCWRFYYCVLILFIIPCSSLCCLVLWLSKKKKKDTFVYCIFILYGFSSSYQWQEDSSLLKCFLCCKILMLNIYFVGLIKPEIKREAYFVLEKICAYGCMFVKHPQKKGLHFVSHTDKWKVSKVCDHLQFMQSSIY